VTDIEKTADGLTPNMVKSLTWWCHDGEISSEVDDATRRGVVRRNLGTWSSGQCVTLTDLGQQVREVLLERQRVAKEAELQMLADQAAAERKIRDEGYEAGRLLAQRQNEDQIRDLWNTVQILISRYPGCETVITVKEMEERSDLGVVSTVDEVDGGKRLKVRQR
jgi:hypothetical protein